MRWFNFFLSLIIFAFFLLTGQGTALAKKQRKKFKKTDVQTLFIKRKSLYDRVSFRTGLDWPYIAAIDRYEYTINRVQYPQRKKSKNKITGVTVAKEDWSGPLNPNLEDTNPKSIRFFHGIGRDGSGDQVADRQEDEDVLYSVAIQALRRGTALDDLSIGLWEYYQNTRAVQRIMQFAKIYEHYNRLDLRDHAFPLPIGSHYSYRDTWGGRRGWGGRRIHEGTDLFAYYGMPVKSSCHGIIELKGWNKYGGWRIGLRDLDNLYYYYAHLSRFSKNLKVGDIVEPGKIIGYVGNSGYGPLGTQGKFPPHLHYGLYQDRGLIEWAFDPYPLLRNWEQKERQKKKN